MIAKSDFLLRIKEDLNLNIYEVKTWAALLSRGIASAGELADISGVPRSRCYDVLESLESKGFIIRRIGKPIKYIAVSPKEIVSRVSKGIDEETENAVNIYEKLKETATFREIELLHKTGIEHLDITKLSTSIIGRSVIQKQIKDMIRKAKKNIFIITSKQGFLRKLNMLKSIAKMLNKQGVDIKIVAPVGEKTKSYTRNIKNISIINDDLATRAVIVDGKQLLFSISNEESNKDSDTAILVDSPFFANAIHKIFDKHF